MAEQGGRRITPKVAGLSVLVLDYNVPTVLGDADGRVFTGGSKGQMLTLVSRDDQVIFTDTAKVQVAGGSWSGSGGDTITLVFAGGVWYEVSRSNN